MTQKTKLSLTWPGKEERLRLEPRILIENPAKSYHAKMRREGDIFDNILIKGDNLLALKALERDFSGKVKCIYIDPPFNTGAAFEHYNDGLEHSIWLGLMRQRLLYMRELLRRDGFIFVHLDDKETHYCKVLMDELFGRENYLNTIILSTNKPFGFKGTSDRLFKQAQHVLVYSRDKASASLSRNAMYIEKGYDPQYKWVFDNPKLPESEWTWRPIGECVAAAFGFSSVREAKRSMGSQFDDEVFLFAVDNAERVFRTASVSGGALAKRRETVKLSRERNKEVIRHPDDDMDYQFIGGERVLYYRERLSELDGVRLPVEVVTDIWTDISIEGLAAEGGVDFPKGKKPERAIMRALGLASEPGDLILDSFGGSGTTGAVAHKMGRRWIMVEMGDHADTHIVPRLQNVIDGNDQGGISKSVEWKGGGGFRYFTLAPSLLEKDLYGNWVISKDYNAVMLSEAMCKHMGFTYAPSSDSQEYWRHGASTETDFIYVTTQALTHEACAKISHDVGPDRSLLICCKAFDADADAFENLTLVKIPTSILQKCEWGRDDYSLNIQNLPQADDEKPDDAAEEAQAMTEGLPLFAGEEGDE